MARKVVTVTTPETRHEVRDERELTIAVFLTKAAADRFAATGIYPAGMMRSDRE